jgi:hypothetical protein
LASGNAAAAVVGAAAFSGPVVDWTATGAPVLELAAVEPVVDWTATGAPVVELAAVRPAVDAAYWLGVFIGVGDGGAPVDTAGGGGAL